MILALWAPVQQIEPLERGIAELKAKLGEPPKTLDNSGPPPSQGRKGNKPPAAGRRARKRRQGLSAFEAIQAAIDGQPPCGPG